MSNRPERHRPTRGYLVSIGVDPEIKVLFQFNPNQIIDRRTVGYAVLNAPGMLLPLRQYGSGGDRTVIFTVVVDGTFRGAARATGGDAPREQRDVIEFDEVGGIGPELDKYRAFLYPQTPDWPRASTETGGFTGLYAAPGTVFTAPPRCRLQLGPRSVDCVVTEVVITERLHTRDFAPLRAEVQVTCVELTPYDPGPTIKGRN
jgi:hypothetical protein